MLKVFVYGTLKPGERNYQRYCGDRVITQVPAIVPGKLFALPFGYPALLWERNLANLDDDISPTQDFQNQAPDQNNWAQDNWVQGYLLTFANNTELAKLDALESYRLDRPPSVNEYQRLEMEVFSRDSNQPHNLPTAANSGMTPSSLPAEKPISLGTAWVYVMSRERIARSRGVFLPQGVWSSCLAKGSLDPQPTGETETQHHND
jgi:gamma-glutamylcyclotransferase (GGCT)/AIG2-like uncharacterized protein YtfP